MPNIIVIYNTVTGFSRTYAEWIADDLDAKIFPWNDAKKLDLTKYDLIIYGAGVRMSMIRGFRKFRKKIIREHLEGRVIVWANGGTPVHPERDWKVPATTFTKKELAINCYPFYYFEGGVRYEGLNLFEKTLMRIFSKRIQRYRHRGEWAVQVADNIAKGYDHTSYEAIAPLIERAQKMVQQ